MAFDGGCGMMGLTWTQSMMGWAGFGLLSLVALVVVFWALIDAVQRKDLDSGKKVGWILIILAGWFLPLSLLGAIVYFAVGKRK